MVWPPQNTGLFGYDDHACCCPGNCLECAQVASNQAVGFSEFAGPSDPIRKYNRKTFSGSITYSIRQYETSDPEFPPTDCSRDPETTITYEFTGANYWSAPGYYHAEATLTITGTGWFSGYSGVYPVEDFSLVGLGSLDADTITETSWTKTGDETCRILDGAGGSKSAQITEGSATMALTEELTAPFEITVYDEVCAVGVTGLVPDSVYTFILEYWRRVSDCTPPCEWELFESYLTEITTDGSGNGTLSGLVTPKAEGYDTEARTDCVFTYDRPADIGPPM